METTSTVAGWALGALAGLVLIAVGLPVWITLRYLFCIRARRQWWLDHPEAVAERRRVSRAKLPGEEKPAEAGRVGR